MSSIIFILSLCIMSLVSLATAQAGPNTLATYNPTIRTESVNGTIFVVPMSKSSVQGALPPQYKLLGQAFGESFDDTHPVLVAVNYMRDIRQLSLQIEALLGALVIIPAVDRGDGKTPFNYPVRTFIGGPNGKDIMALVPAIVGSLETTPISVASFTPNDKVSDAAGQGNFFQLVRQLILPNSISGPSLAPEAIDTQYSYSDSGSIEDLRYINKLINSPLLLPLGNCARQSYHFNETFAEPSAILGKVTLGKLSDPQGIGIYDGVMGLAGNAELVGYNPETCESAAAKAAGATF